MADEWAEHKATTVTKPIGRRLWRTSFGCNVEPSTAQRAARGIHDAVFWFMPTSAHDSLYVFFGPAITISNPQSGSIMSLRDWDENGFETIKECDDLIAACY